MSDTLRISRLAARSSFTANTLRGEAALTPMRFIDRAKRLGLSFEEIRELVEILDQGQCAPSRTRSARASGRGRSR